MDGESIGGAENGTLSDQDLIGQPIIINPDGSTSEDTGGDGIPVIEPSQIAAEGNGERRGRGRPRGSRNASTKQQPQKEVQADLTGLLLSLHMMGAAILKAPELALDEDEAKKLAGAVARVNKEFGVQIMSPKAAALMNLAMVGGAIYIPRAIAVVNNRKAAKTTQNKGNSNAHSTDDVFTTGASPHATI